MASSSVSRQGSLGLPNRRIYKLKDCCTLNRYSLVSGTVLFIPKCLRDNHSKVTQNRKTKMLPKYAFLNQRIIHRTEKPLQTKSFKANLNSSIMSRKKNSQRRRIRKNKLYLSLCRETINWLSQNRRSGRKGCHKVIKTQHLNNCTAKMLNA